MAKVSFGRFDLRQTEPGKTSSEAGRREIMKRLEDLVTGPTEVIDHQAAVRAGTRNRIPVSLFHKDYTESGTDKRHGLKGFAAGTGGSRN